MAISGNHNNFADGAFKDDIERLDEMANHPPLRRGLVWKV